MKKKSKAKPAAKAKAPKRSSSKRSSAPQTEMPDLVAVMLKMTERLEVLEQKMDLVVSQTSGGRSPERPVPNYNPRPQQQAPYVPPVPPAPTSQPAPNPGMKPHTGHHHGVGRTLYQAVCADCNVACEVPFKPIPDRPTYCKACFAKRKEERRNGGGLPPKQNPAAPKFNTNQPPEVNGNTLHEPKRHVKVIRKGVGRVTISDFTRQSGHGHPHKLHQPKFKPKRR